MFLAFLPMVALGLSACSNIGDFGRPRDYNFLNESAAKFEKIQNLYSDEHSTFVLSQDESDVRRAANHFHQPLPSPLVSEKVVQLIKARKWNRLSNYADSQTLRGYADGNARAGEIDELMAADFAWLERFEKSGRRVRAADRERLFVLEEDSGSFSQDDRISAHARIEENAAILRAALVDLDRRLLAFHYAVERVKLEWPQTSLSPTETRLNQLRETASRLRVEFGFDGTAVEYEEELIIEPVKGTKPRTRPSKMRLPNKPITEDSLIDEKSGSTSLL